MGYAELYEENIRLKRENIMWRQLYDRLCNEVYELKHGKIQAWHEILRRQKAINHV